MGKTRRKLYSRRRRLRGGMNPCKVLVAGAALAAAATAAAAAGKPPPVQDVSLGRATRNYLFGDASWENSQVLGDKLAEYIEYPASVFQNIGSMNWAAYFQKSNTESGSCGTPSGSEIKTPAQAEKVIKQYLEVDKRGLKQFGKYKYGDTEFEYETYSLDRDGKTITISGTSKTPEGKDVSRRLTVPLDARFEVIKEPTVGNDDGFDFGGRRGGRRRNRKTLRRKK